MCMLKNLNVTLRTGRTLIDFKQDKDMIHFGFKLLCLLDEEYIRKGMIRGRIIN